MLVVLEGSGCDKWNKMRKFGYALRDEEKIYWDSMPV